MNENKCKGIWGLLFGHKFRGRWHEEDNTAESVAIQAKTSINYYISSTAYIPDSDGNIENILNGFRNMNNTKSTYVHDICLRCGKIVNNK